MLKEKRGPGLPMERLRVGQHTVKIKHQSFRTSTHVHLRPSQQARFAAHRSHAEKAR